MDSSSSHSRPQKLSLPPPQTSYPVPPVPPGQSHYRSLLPDHPSEPSSTLALPPIPPLHPFPTSSYHQLYHSWHVPFVPGIDPLSDPTQHQPRLSQGQVPHLPEWQPDQLVRNCPICYSTFTLFFRRHHCRKCGRVVCAQCSPNRLTLPSATVVRPPGEVPPTQGQDTLALPSPAQWGGLLGGSMYSPPAIGTSNRHSWAGSVNTPGGQSPVGFADWRGQEGPAPGMEDVRVCCDCFSSTSCGQNAHTSASASSTSIHGTWNGSSLPATQGRPPAAELWTPPGIDTPDGNGRRRRQSLQGGRSLPYNYDPASRQQSASYMPQSSASGPDYTLPPPVPSSQSRSQLANAYSITPQLQAKYASYFGARDRMFGFSGSSSQHGPPANMPSTNVTQRNTNQSNASQSTQPQHISQPHAQPRASTGRSRVKLKETDYCPICTLPLPPPHPETGDESEREAHVQDCIRSHEASSSPHGISNHPLAAMSQAEPRSGLSSTATTMSVAEFLRQSGVAPKPSGRMVVYKAREEDTWDYSSEDGREKTQIEVSLSSHTVIDLTRDDETPTETIARRQPPTDVKCRKRAECVICFEEFEIGELIARLECLCRYHKGCIREWFDRKGNGDCPVHAVRE